MAKYKFLLILSIFLFSLIGLSLAQTEVREYVTIMSGRLPSGTSLLSCAPSGNSIYCFGGERPYIGAIDEIDRYYVDGDTVYTMSAKLPSGRRGLSCVSIGNYIYCLGGYSYIAYNPGTYLDEIVRYDPTTDSITIMSGKLSSGRDFLSCVPYQNRYIYCFGGVGYSVINEIVKYDTVSNTVTIMSARFPTGIYFLSCALYGDSIYCFGGIDSNYNYLDKIFRYDINTDSLVEMNSKLPYPMHGHSCAPLGDYIYCFGGFYFLQGSPVYSDNIIRYDPRADSISIISAKLPTGRTGLSCTSYANSIYCFGGLGYINGQTVYLDEIVKFYTTTISVTTTTTTTTIPTYPQQTVLKYVYLFVPNSGGMNSISEINITDPSAPKEVSRHWTVPSGWYGNPSRTAIDHYGNAWIGNRATNTLVKVGNLGLGTCVDKNGNGKIDTTRDTNNNGVIEDSEMVSFENDECILKEVALPITATGNFWVVGTMGCAGCHCSGAAQGTIDLTSVIRGTGSYTFPIWCSESWGEEICKFRIKIEMPDGSIRYIEDGGDYGDISVRAYRSSGVYSDCNNDPNTIIQRANTEYNQWYSVDWWSGCDSCDFYARIEMNVKNVDWVAIRLEVYADDSMYVWTNSPYYSRQSLSDGAGVRAVCIDANDNVYAGLFDYQKMFYISKDGQILKTIDLSQVGCRPYGCVVDKNGYVWISCVVDYKLVKYDPKTDKVDSYYQGIYVYGLTPTVAGDGVVFNAWVNSQIRKIGLDGSTKWSVSGPYGGRGITVDKDDNIYAVGSSYGEVWKLDKNGNLIKSISGVCGEPTGIGLDYYGNVWVACYDGQIVRLDKDLNVLNRVTIGGNHYVYSDWTGYLLTEIVAPLPQYPITTGALVLIPMLLGNPLFFAIVFGLALAASIEKKVNSGGKAFILTFLGVLVMFSVFGGIVPLWLVLVLIVIVIGGIVYFRRGS